MGHRRTRRHKSKKNRKTRSRKYRRQRGGVIESQQSQPILSGTNITENVNTSLNKANESIKDVEKKTESTVSDWVNSLGSFFNSTSPTTGGRKRRRHKRTHKK
jgi:hypothetical protein